MISAASGVFAPKTVSGIRGVLFDVDGTLYAQPWVRAKMAGELALHAVRTMSPYRAAHVARVISTFRRTREELRTVEADTEPLDEIQFSRPAERLGVSHADVREVIDEWMMARPLKHLRQARHPGLLPLLAGLQQRGVLIGALSDYPPDAKLQALGVAEYFSLRLCTAERGINAFKPHPAGYWRACEIWGLAPQEVLYVGDRPEVDGAGAAAAGTHCIILGRGGGRRGRRGHNPPPLRDLDALAQLFAVV